MRYIPNFLIVLIVAIALATPAMALDCSPAQGVAVELDFQRGSAQQPLPDLPLRVIGEQCVDGESVYALKGMPGKFRSKGAALDTFASVQKLLFFGIVSAEVPKIMQFVAETMAAAAPK